MINEKHLKFLDFLLPRLSNEYPEGGLLEYYANEYQKDEGEEFSYSDLIHFQELYDCEYFTVKSDLGYVVIEPETKSIITDYETLSNYLQQQAILIAEEHTEINNSKVLKQDNLKLQNDNLRYLRKIRDQEQGIRDLDEQNKFIETLKGYWWLFGACLLIGYFLNELINL